MRRVIAICPLTNVASVNIYDIDFKCNNVLAGINNEKPLWHEITDELTFYMGDDEDEDQLCIHLDECIRINN